MSAPAYNGQGGSPSEADDIFLFYKTNFLTKLSHNV